MKLMKKAFTLVELLIVIAIIGILAVAVLIALDPIEQTNRAQDVKLITASSEIKGAVNRYYAAKQYFPWCTNVGCTLYRAPCSALTSQSQFSVGGSCADVVLQELIASGDLKAGITVDTKLYLDLDAGGTTFSLAYNPYSKSERTKYATVVGASGMYTDATCATLGTGGAGGTCPNTSTTCHYCVF